MTMSKTERATPYRRVRGNIWDHGLKSYRWVGKDNKAKRREAKRELRKEVRDL